MSSMDTKPYMKSFERVHNYPIVNDSLLFALSYYQWAKSKNTILDVTLSKLEETLRIVKDKTEPYAAEKFHYADETLFNQLEKFEKLCPIILESSNTIKDIPAKIYHERIESTVQRVAKPVSLTLSFIAQTSGIAAYMVSSTISQAIPSALLPIETTKKILNKTEELLDKFLPENDKETNNERFDSREVLSTKFKRLSKKTQQRIFKKIIDKINHFKEVSFEKLSQIKNIINEIKQRKSSVCKDTSSNSSESNIYRQLIKNGLYYSDCLQHIVVSTAQSVPSILCNGSINIMDHLNEKLFSIRNTILESSNQKYVSEKKLNDAADTIDLVRSWIEYLTDRLQEYYNAYEKRRKGKAGVNLEEEDLPESNGLSSEEEEVEEEDEEDEEDEEE